MSLEVPSSGRPLADRTARAAPPPDRTRSRVPGASAVAAGRATAGGAARSRGSFDSVGTSATPDVRMRRIRRIPEPPAGFIRFEYDVTAGQSTAHR